MAATQVVPFSGVVSFDVSKRTDRQDAVDSVLGTMGAEGELPSEETIALMHKFVDGEIEMNELVETIFANARA
jgi:Antitoxin VbhA